MQSGVVGEAVTVGSCQPAGAPGRHCDAANNRLKGFRQSPLLDPVVLLFGGPSAQ